MDYFSPLRYPGGKGKISNYFKQTFRDNSLFDGVYVEPYAGGASVALSLLMNQYSSKIIINDIDISIYSIWHSVIHHTDALCQMIHDTPLSVEEWRKQKGIQKDRKNYDYLQLGFSTFYLNRTNRSGILNAGVIGGLEQKGEWKIDARFNKKELIRRITRIADYKDSIEIYNEDAVSLVRKLKKVLPSNTLFYLDPPYYVKGRDLYLNYYNDKDHRDIANEISSVKKQKWIITYDNNDFIANLYSKYRKFVFNINYSAAKASTGSELIIYSDNMEISKDKSLKLAL